MNEERKSRALDYLLKTTNNGEPFDAEEFKRLLFATDPPDDDDPFGVALRTALGDAMRDDDSLCIEVWSALANVDWIRNDGLMASYSFRAAGGLIATIIGRGCYMDWYCSGPYAVVSDRVRHGLGLMGWRPNEADLEK